jgi:two-component system copper resistance phosphate regulon response regulator CusR
MPDEVGTNGRGVCGRCRLAVKILLVEDDPRIARLVLRGLEEGFVADHAANGEDGLHAASSGSYELVILDVLLPGRDGFEILARLRRTRSTTRVLMLTARDAVSDRVKGLEGGADDYLVKPFAFSELLARIRALLRRRRAARRRSGTPIRARSSTARNGLAACRRAGRW